MTVFSGGTTFTAPILQELACDQRLLTLLDVAREQLHLQVAWLSVFDDGQQIIAAAQGPVDTIGAHVGARFPISQSLCARVLAGALPAVIPDVSQTSQAPHEPDSPKTGPEVPIGAYVGAPWRDATGKIAGMVCCGSRQAQPALNQQSAQFVAVLAQHIAYHLAQRDVRQMTAHPVTTIHNPHELHIS